MNAKVRDVFAARNEMLSLLKGVVSQYDSIWFEINVVCHWLFNSMLHDMSTQPRSSRSSIFFYIYCLFLIILLYI